MYLKFIEWNVDNTKFLVEADTDEDAVNAAIKGNIEYDSHFSYFQEEMKKRNLLLNDKNNYSVKDVDFNFLYSIFSEKECLGFYAGSIIFTE